MPNYTIDKESDIPLYMQIRANIEEAILTGELSPGDKLPSVSCLAKDIWVTQATVRRALQDLGKAGHTCCHVGRGTFVQDATSLEQNGWSESFDDTTQTGMRGKNNHPPTENSREFAARRLRRGIGQALRDIMSLAWRIKTAYGPVERNAYPGTGLHDLQIGPLRRSYEKDADHLQESPQYHAQSAG
jgi:DNA-binding transcriptional regulator YhcF (GntR family)